MDLKSFWLLLFSLFCLEGSAVNAQYTVIHNFNRINGANPTGSLTLSGNTLYGMTDSGGVHNYGCIFSIDTNGGNYRVVLYFDSINGAYPAGSLTLSEGILYGMTSAGGVHNDGSIFSIDTNGSSYKDLLDFNNTNGAYPLGSLTLYNGMLYGMTYFGGVYNVGIVFSIDTNGNEFKDLLDFNFTNGANPLGSLICASGVLYGMTGEEGEYGNIFSIDTNGNGYKDLYDFYGDEPPKYFPYGSLTIFDNKLYGMASKGGSVLGDLYVGNIFSIDTNGTGYNDLFDFDINDGASPYGSLVLSGSQLYGMTYVGGMNGGGTIFSIDTNGNEFKDFYYLSRPTGSLPWGDLTLSENILYGMTNAGGVDSVGVIFKIDTNTIASINNLKEGKGIMNIYPNPNNGTFTLSLSNVTVACNVVVFNILGEEVYTAAIAQSQSNNTINLTGQPSGVYFYRVLSEDGGLVGEGKVVVEK